MHMNTMNHYGNRGFGGPPQPQRQGGRRGNSNRGGGGFRNSRFDHNNQNQHNQNNQQQRNQNQGQGDQRPNEVSCQSISSRNLANLFYIKPISSINHEPLPISRNWHRIQTSLARYRDRHLVIAWFPSTVGWPRFRAVQTLAFEI